MFLNKGKHIEREIGGIRVRVVEDEATEDRIQFLKKLLEHNGYEVLVEEIPPKPPAPPPPPSSEERAKDPSPEGETISEDAVEESKPTWVIGVTDIIFNPVVAVYHRGLRTFDGHHVTPDYWNQKTTDAEPNYWDLERKKF